MATWDLIDGVVEMPDGRRIRGTGVRRPRGEIPEPEFAVYLLGRDPGVDGWPNRWVRWRDFGLPRSRADFVAAVREAHTRTATERVEFACGGGVGRTGTALAATAILSGVTPDEAVDWVRAHYDRRAVETPWQRRFVRSVAPALRA